MLEQTVGTPIKFLDDGKVIDGYSIVISTNPLITIDVPKVSGGDTFIYNWDVSEGWHVDTDTLKIVLGC